MHKAFEPRWEEIRVQIPIKRIFKQETVNSEEIVQTSPIKVPKKKFIGTFVLNKFWKKSATTKDIKDETHSNSVKNFDNETKQYKSKIDTRVYKSSIIKIPRRIYEEDCFVLDLYLSCKSKAKKSNFSQKSSDQDSQNLETLWKVKPVKTGGDKPYSLELELSSPKFLADPAKKQSQDLNSDKIHFNWNCKVSGLGKHRLEFFIRMVDPSNPSNTMLVSRRGWDVEVVGLLGLSGKQYRVIKEVVLPILGLTWAVSWAVFTFNSPKPSTAPPSSPFSHESIPAPITPIPSDQLPTGLNP